MDLVFSTGGIGDVVVTLSMIRDLSETEGRPVVAVSSSSAAEIVEVSNLASRIIVIERSSLKSPGNLLRIAREMRETGASRAFITFASRGFWNTSLAAAARIGERYGFREPKASWGLTASIPIEEGIHHLEFNARLLEMAGIEASRRAPSLSLPNHLRSGIERFIEPEDGIIAPYAAFHLGTGDLIEKAWPVEGFNEVARILASRGLGIVVVGSLIERERSARIVGCTDLAGRTDILETAAVLASAEVVVSSDTGPLHLGLALGRPGVGIYGPTDPAFNGPLGPGVVVSAGIECSPCHGALRIGRKVECRNPSLVERGKILRPVPECLSSVTPGMVVSAVEKALDEDRARPCPICGGSPRRALGTRGGLRLSRCGDCGSASADPLPSDEIAERWYRESAADEDYYRDYIREREGGAFMEFDRLLDLVERIAPKGRILEVGSAAGFFLRRASMRGWETLGIEPIPYLRDYASERGLRTIPSVSELVAEEGFEAVVLLDLLCHLPDPRAVLAELSRRLVRGGVILLRTGTEAAKPLSEWDLPNHLHFLTEDGLRRLMDRSGLSVIRDEARPAAAGALRRLGGRMMRRLGPLGAAVRLLRPLYDLAGGISGRASPTGAGAERIILARPRV